MQVHIFRGPGRVFGFTAQASGENLPQKYAPWSEFKTIELRKDEHTPGVDHRGRYSLMPVRARADGPSHRFRPAGSSSRQAFHSKVS
jgi:hypothetical protein